MSFENLGLHPKILAGVKKQGYTEPTPIQQQAIPIIVQGKDILARAQTGTGKTAAFVLPLLHLLNNKNHSNDRRPRALILTPTRELAAQVGKSVTTYGQELHMRSTIIFGGVNINPQKKYLKQGVDIVIGTPGRLLDLIRQKSLNLSLIEILVIDEADRMLDMGFIHDIRKIINLIQKKRQTLFFSATYSKEIKALSDTILNKPEIVEIESDNTEAENINQSIYLISKSRKRALLSHLIKKNNWNQMLIFTKTKHGANRLAQQLEKDGIVTAAIHGNKSQAARTRALENFKTYKVQALIATDLASRGLDIDHLPHVINYELPHVSENYVHRIGRTGRAGRSGEAISLIANDEIKLLRAVEKLIKKTIPVKTIEGFVTLENVPEQNKPAKAKAHKPYNHDNNKNKFRGSKPNKFKSFKGNSNNKTRKSST
jgi:ATP-dependent RNA helicase RhlE